jgi:23S rRNA (uracil1939-C5)-methyltransferase
LSEAELGRVDALTHEGEGVVHGGKTVFVAGALPGETIRFRRVRRRKRHDEAQLLEVLEPSAERVVPRCSHFGVCGGCALQHLEARRQIEAKQAELRETLERVGRATPETWLEPIRGPEWAYRRRARLGARYVPKKGRVVVGFRERLTPYVAAIDRCEVLASPAGELIGPLSTLLTGLSIRDRVPQVEVAVGDNAAALVLRVLSAPSAADLAELRRFELTHGVRLYLQPGGIDSIVRLEPSTADSDSPLQYDLPDFGVQLQFEPTDFLQINGPINRALIRLAVELLGLTPDSRVLDLYCGLGNFTLPMARTAASVLGVEGDAALVARARHNAARNGIANAAFMVADLTQPLPHELPRLREGFTHVLLDPPRAGARDVMPTIARTRPQRVLYISCHPGTLGRDVEILVHDHGFRLLSAGVVDMFPHTTHVESVALLAPGA